MIDKDAAPNLIKVRNLHSEMYVRTQSILLSEIIDGNIKTLGFEIRFMGRHNLASRKKRLSNFLRRDSRIGLLM